MDAGTLEGTRLGDRYLLGEVLGRGGMAEVYDAADERLGRAVAVKVLRPALAMNPEVRLRFEAEARAAARLSHPNVVTVFDTGEDAGTPYIVMERLPGETVADRMKAGPVDQEWLRRVAGDVLQALAAAHGAGIIHRDVKPGNILLAPDGCAKVADFGIAKSTEALGGTDITATNMLLGTPAYLAPERIQGHAATAESDLYSLGVLLYEALAGTKPHSGPTPMAIARSINDGNVAPIQHLRPDVDPGLATVVGRSMSPLPGDRYHSADAMRQALEDDATVAADMSTAAPAGAGGAVVAGVGAGAAEGLSPTTVMPADAQVPVTDVIGPGPSSADPSAVGVGGVEVGGHRFDRRAIAVVAGGALLLLLLLVVVVKLGSSSGGNQTSSGNALAAQLRSLAERIQPVDPAAASAVTATAQQQAGTDRTATAAAATAALRRVTDDHQAGTLSDSLASEATSLLEKAGASASAAQTTTTAAAPPTPPVTTASTVSTVKKGKGKKGD